MAKTLAEATAALVTILEPLSPADRQRVITATLALLSDQPSPVQIPGVASSASSNELPGVSNDFGLGERTEKWLRQNNVTHDQLEEVFHFSAGRVEIIASDLPGASKRERTAQAYLLEGFRAFLETGEAKFSDDSAMQLTKRFGAFDVNNHAGSRKSLGNALSGSKNAGFELSQPGLRSAAALVKAIATVSLQGVSA